MSCPAEAPAWWKAMRHPRRTYASTCDRVPHRWRPCPVAGGHWCEVCGIQRWPQSVAERDETLLAARLEGYGRQLAAERSQL